MGRVARPRTKLGFMKMKPRQCLTRVILMMLTTILSTVRVHASSTSTCDKCKETTFNNDLLWCNNCSAWKCIWHPEAETHARTTQCGFNDCRMENDINKSMCRTINH